MEEWLEHRKAVAREGERALWASRTGDRLSARSADRDVRSVAAAAGLVLSCAHVAAHVPDRLGAALSAHTVQQIAEEFGVTRPTIYRHLRRGAS